MEIEKETIWGVLQIIDNNFIDLSDPKNTISQILSEGTQAEEGVRAHNNALYELKIQIAKKYQVCAECGKVVDIKAGEEITPEVGRLADTYGASELCRACHSKGWSEATIEDFNKDGFHTITKSPIQPNDLD